MMRKGPQEFEEFERRLERYPLRRVMQGLLDAQLVRHHRPDGTTFHIETKGVKCLEKLTQLFKMAGWEEEVEDIMEAWA